MCGSVEIEIEQSVEAMVVETVEGNDPIYGRALSPRVRRVVPFSPGRNGDPRTSRRFNVLVPTFRPLSSG
jgi:hypothetical protein